MLIAASFAWKLRFRPPGKSALRAGHRAAGAVLLPLVRGHLLWGVDFILRVHFLGGGSTAAQVLLCCPCGSLSLSSLMLD